MPPPPPPVNSAWYLQKIKAIAGRKRWIVVFKGADVGVYDDWLEASRWVIGVTDAIWNGFYSLDQAEDAFACALDDGLVEVVSD